MDIKQEFGIHNEFEFVRRNSKTGEVIETYKSYNILLNNWWTQYLSASTASCLSYIHFGNGTTAPVVTDTKLTTPISSKATTEVAVDYSRMNADGVISRKMTIRLQDTEYVGYSISEVGFSYQSTTTAGLLTKSLIKDQNGNPVSITKNAGEVLDIYGTLFIRLQPDYHNGQIARNMRYSRYFWNSLLAKNIFSTDGQSRYFKTRLIPTSARYSFEYTSEKIEQSASTAYDVANKTIKRSSPNLTVAIGNIGGIRQLATWDFMVDLPNQIIQQPVIAKEVIATGDGATKDFNPAFGWIRDNGTFKVYVNDVQVNASCDYGLMVPSTYINGNMRLTESSNLVNEATGLYAATPGWHSTDTTIGYIPGAYVILENPASSDGLDSIGLYYGVSLDVSDDMVNWNRLHDGPAGVATVTIPSAYKYMKYWKFTTTLTSSNPPGFLNFTSTAYLSKKLIHLETAPPAGSTVTCTYQPDCIAKDDKHVINDVALTLYFNEYLP